MSHEPWAVHMRFFDQHRSQQLAMLGGFLKHKSELWATRHDKRSEVDRVRGAMIRKLCAIDILLNEGRYFLWSKMSRDGESVRKFKGVTQEEASTIELCAWKWPLHGELAPYSKMTFAWWMSFILKNDLCMVNELQKKIYWWTLFTSEQPSNLFVCTFSCTYSTNFTEELYGRTLFGPRELLLMMNSLSSWSFFLKFYLIVNESSGLFQWALSVGSFSGLFQWTLSVDSLYKLSLRSSLDELYSRTLPTKFSWETLTTKLSLRSFHYEILSWNSLTKLSHETHSTHGLSLRNSHYETLLTNSPHGPFLRNSLYKLSLWNSHYETLFTNSHHKTLFTKLSLQTLLTKLSREWTSFTNGFSPHELFRNLLFILSPALIWNWKRVRKGEPPALAGGDNARRIWVKESW